MLRSLGKHLSSCIDTSECSCAPNPAAAWSEDAMLCVAWACGSEHSVSTQTTLGLALQNDPSP